MQSAGEGLNKLLGELLRRAPADEAALKAWPLVCGSVVASKTRALSCREGVLRVEVPDSGWSTHLRHMAGAYLKALNHVVPEPVRFIQFVLPGEVRPD